MISMTIPFSKHHLELIRQGKKTSTLRSLKYDYMDRFYNISPDMIVEIKERLLVFVDPNSIAKRIILGYLEYGREIIDKELVAKSEGYNSWDEVVSGLKKMRHKLPKEMWLYRFRVIKEHENPELYEQITTNEVTA